MKIIKHIAFLLIVSCSHTKWDPQKDSRVMLPGRGHKKLVYYDRSGNLDERKYSKLKNMMYINNSSSWSCFKDLKGGETNYVELSDKEITFYRLAYLNQKMNNFRQETKRTNKGLRTNRESSVSNWIDIESKRCMFEGTSQKYFYVVSERYHIGGLR